MSDPNQASGQQTLAAVLLGGLTGYYDATYGVNGAVSATYPAPATWGGGYQGYSQPPYAMPGANVTQAAVSGQVQTKYLLIAGVIGLALLAFAWRK